MAKTNAENCRNYYNRKKAAKALEKKRKPVPIKKTGAERARACRLRKKIREQGNQSSLEPEPVTTGINLNHLDVATVSSSVGDSNIHLLSNQDIVPNQDRDLLSKDFIMEHEFPQSYVPTMDDSIDPLQSVQIKTELPYEETMETGEIVSTAEGHTNPDENYSGNYRNETPVYPSISVVNFEANSSIVASTSTDKKATTNQPLRRNSIHKNVKQKLPTTLQSNNDLKEFILKTYSRTNKTKSKHVDEINASNNINTKNTSTYFDACPQIKVEVKEEPIENEFYFKPNENENQFIDENNEAGKSNSEYGGLLDLKVEETKIEVSSSVAHSVCTICNNAFPTELFASHECVNKNFNFVCIKSENQQKSDVEHLNDEEYENQLLCFSCQEVFESVELLKSHRRSCMGLEPEPVGSNALTCGFCDVTFKNKTELKEHNSTTHFWCSICLSLWKTAAIAETHQKAHKKYYCDACKCFFDTVRQLTYHEHKILHNKLIPSIKKDKPFACDRCSNRFDLKYKLIEHRNSCTKTSSKKPMEFSCKVCLKKFDVRYMYLRHVQSKCETKFKCRFYCNKVFRTFELLENHVRTHHNEEILWCRLCNLTFKEKYVMDIHVCVALECKICGEMFLKKNFNKHKCFESRNK